MLKRIVKRRYYAVVVDVYVVEVDPDDEARDDSALVAHTRNFIDGIEPRSRKVVEDPLSDSAYEIEDLGLLDEIVEALKKQ